MFRNISRADKMRLAIGFPFYFTGYYYSRFTERFSPLAKVTRNWWSVLLVYTGLKREATINFRNGDSFMLSRKNLSEFNVKMELEALPKRVKEKLSRRGGMLMYRAKGKTLRLRPEVAPQIATEFSFDVHAQIDVRNRDVVDIGAYVADSALYFCVAGRARHVYGYEPYPKYFDLAREVVDENGLSGKISLFNSAVSGAGAPIFINETDPAFTVRNEMSKKFSKRVRSSSLNAIVKGFGIDHGALKVDCEGSEYEIFEKASSQTLQKFDEINVEYHYGYLDLARRLRSEGFTVSYTKPRYFFKGLSSEPMLSGDLVAKRKRGA